MFSGSVNVVTVVTAVVGVGFVLSPGAAARPGGPDPVGAPVSVAPLPHAECIPPTERAHVERIVAENVARLGLSGAGAPDAAPAPYPFHPQAGNYFQDLRTGNFVDLNPAAAVGTFECGAWSYNGHGGHDVALRSFGEQAIGVPVYAALDGTVTYAHDGEPDMNTSCVAGVLANAVVVQHAANHQSWYWHLKLGSVAVAVGQVVKAGTFLGMTASSGCSSGPHLHFETRYNGAVFEPFAGPCRPGASGWLNQPALPAGPYVDELWITATHPQSVPWYPLGGSTANPPRDAQIAFGDPMVWLIMKGANLKSSGTCRYRFFRPDGSLAHDSGTLGYPGNGAFWGGGNSPIVWAVWTHFRGFNIPDMHTIAGTWTVSFEINDTPMLTAPIEVVPVRDPEFNRPPNPISAAMDPAAPGPDDVIFCRVTGGPLYLDDPDWDIVRYRYVWTVNGSVIRDATTAAMSDALARSTVPNGALLACTVTPSDGKPNGTGAAAQAVVRVGCYPDCDGGGTLTVTDFGCFQTAFVTGDPYADCDGSTTLTAADFGCFQSAFVAGCP